MTLEDKKDQAIDDLKLLLYKLGLRSAQAYIAGALTPRELERSINRMQTDFGRPDQLIMSSQAFADLGKAFGGKGPKKK